jgi:methanogenic corrinoid protein MtbC1
MVEKGEILDQIGRSISDLEGSEKTRKLVRRAFELGFSVQEVVEKGLQKGLDEVGKNYETGLYALGELAYSGTIALELLEELKPRLSQAKMEKKGTIVMGAVSGDIHDIGKNIVKMLMMCKGWDVHDLGVDVPPDAFVKEVEETKADILGLTALLTTTAPSFKLTIDKLKERGIRKNVKVMIAGNAANEELAKEIGADGVATDAESGIRKCEEWVKK